MSTSAQAKGNAPCRQRAADLRAQTQRRETSHMPSPPSPSDRAEEESAQSLTAERPPLSQPVGLEALMRL